MISLTPRLKCAAMLARGADRIIDVGCDHGYLSAYMVSDGGASFAYACDINKGPLSKARETAIAHGVSDKIELRLCNGLEGFNPESADTVFICGMGGELISEILSAAPWTKDGKHRLILQPMSRSEKLREFLLNNGYVIEDECLIKEEQRIYCLMSVNGGFESSANGNFYLFTDKMKKEKLFPEFIRRLIGKYQAIFDGKFSAGADVTAERMIIDFLEDYNAHR